MHQISRYYSIYNKEKEIIRCKLCPHNCLIPKGKSGICDTRKNVGGKFYSLIYGKPCAIHVDPIEKKPLYHFYPGKGIFSLGTFGCNMVCKGCQNFDISQIDIEKNIDSLESYSPEDIIEAAENSGTDMIAYTYNEPTIFIEYMIDTAKLAHKKGFKNVIVSNGYINPEPLKELLKHIDGANIDLKSFDEKFYKEYSGAKLKAVLETIETINDSKTWLELTNLVIPSLNDNFNDIKKMCKWVKELEKKKNIPLHFSRFYPYYKAQDMKITSKEMLMKARDIAIAEGLKYVYVGNLGFIDNTYCECGNILIDRGYGMRYANMPGIKNNKCIKCDNFIDGIFS